MRLLPGEEDRLLLFLAAELARRRRGRGLRLNQAEAVALIADEVCEAARDGRRYADVVSAAYEVLGEEDVLDGVRRLVPRIEVEAVFDDGRHLVVVQSDTGQLYRVSTADRSVRRIDLGGAAVTNGDGLELSGRTLYVVRNANELISEVRLDGRLENGRVVSETTDPTFRFPTTAALDQGRLLVVNSQFDQRGLDPVEPFTVSSVKRP